MADAAWKMLQTLEIGLVLRMALTSGLQNKKMRTLRSTGWPCYAIKMVSPMLVDSGWFLQSVLNSTIGSDKEVSGVEHPDSVRRPAAPAYRVRGHLTSQAQRIEGKMHFLTQNPVSLAVQSLTGASCKRFQKDGLLPVLKALAL